MGRLFIRMISKADSSQEKIVRLIIFFIMQFDNARKIACFTTNIIEPQKSLEFQRKTAL